MISQTEESLGRLATMRKSVHSTLAATKIEVYNTDYEFQKSQGHYAHHANVIFISMLDEVA